jgi:hypothetical protein
METQYNLSQATRDSFLKLEPNLDKGKRCFHTQRGGTGTISNEMNWYNPPQFGVMWDRYNNSKLQPHYYWNDTNKLRMLGTKTLDELSEEFNSKKAQTEFLFELCDSSLELLEELFLKLKKAFTFGVPENKTELKKALSYNLTK